MHRIIFALFACEIPRKSCNLRSDSGISETTFDLWCLIRFCWTLQESFCWCLSVLFLSKSWHFSCRHTNINFKLRQVEIFNPWCGLEFIQPQWHVGDGNKGVNMLRHKLWIPIFRRSWECVKYVQPMTKGDAPLKTTGHSQPAPEKREAQATEVILEYYLERNCHACYVTVQWKWKMKSAFRHSERLKLPLLSRVKNKKCLNHISNFRQAWESKEKWKSIMSVFSPQWWCQSVLWRSKIWSLWHCLHHVKHDLGEKNNNFWA